MLVTRWVKPAATWVERGTGDGALFGLDSKIGSTLPTIRRGGIVDGLMTDLPKWVT